MKKLSTQAPLIREAEEKNLAIQQENWREYFGTKLSKFNAKSLAEMSEEKKSELFDDLKKDWERGQKKAEITNEAEVKSDDDFKEYAETVLKKAFGDDYDQKKAEETINGILKKVDGDYGAAVGMLTSGLSESNGSLNENSEIFISDKRFQDLDSLKDDILKNITPAINDFLARQGIKYNPITVKEDRGRYAFVSKPVTGKDLGFFQYGMLDAYIDSFGGGQVPRIREADGKIEFNPLIWFNLHYSYNHGTADTGKQGSNGCPLYPPGEDRSNIWYNIITGALS